MGRSKVQRRERYGSRGRAIAQGKPLINLVVGQGRCGSSMMMRMLTAGGLKYTSGVLEGEGTEDGCGMSSALNDAEDMSPLGVVKVLWPMRGELPRGKSYRAVWMTRDPLCQAASTLKFFKFMNLCGHGDAIELASLQQIRGDIIKTKALLRTLFEGMPAFRFVVVDYGEVLADPLEMSEMIRDTLFDGELLDVHKMAAVVRTDRSQGSLSVMAHDDVGPGFDERAFDAGLYRARR